MKPKLLFTLPSFQQVARNEYTRCFTYVSFCLYPFEHIEKYFLDSPPFVALDVCNKSVDKVKCIHPNF